MPYQLIPPEIPKFDEFGRIIHPQFQAPDLSQFPAQNQQTVIQPTIQSTVQGQIQQQPQISFDPVNVPKSVPTAAERQQIIPPNREDPRFQNSKLRTVLNAIAGGFAGAAGGPKAGVEVGTGLRDAKYNRALADYGVQTEDQKRRLEIEKGQEQRAQFPVKEGITKGSAQVAAQYKGRMADVAETNADTKANDLERKRLDDERKLLRTTVMNDKDKFQIEHPELKSPEAVNWEYMQTLDPAKREAFLEETKNLAEAKKPVKSDQQIENESAARTRGIVKEGGTPEALKTLGAKTKVAAQANIDVKTDPANIKREADLTRARSLATLTNNEKDTMRGAQVALQAFPDIRAQLPLASDKMFGNRWNDFLTGTIGKDPEFAPLRENLGLLQSLVAKLHVGSRGSVHILNKFETLMNAKEMDRDTLTSSLNELEKWLSRYAKSPEGTDPATILDESSRPPIKVNGVEIKRK